MFEQAVIAEYDPYELHDIDAVGVKKLKSPGAILAMPLASMRMERADIADAVHVANAIFGNVWPGLAIVCI
jgi:hypothetical protein